MNSFIDRLNQFPKEKRWQVFEYLVRYVLKNAPIYKDEFVEVWPSRQWPGRLSDTELGIDIVCQNRDGTLTAVQCKNYGLNSTISKKDIQGFVSDSADSRWTQRIIAYTGATKFSAHTLTILNQDTTTSWRSIDENDINDCGLNWKVDQPVLNPTKELYDHQQEALNKVIEGFKSERRGQLIMPCGTGKTLTSLRITEKMFNAGKLPNSLVLVLAPSLSLISQLLKEWYIETKLDSLQAVVVCSDKSATSAAKDYADIVRQHDIQISKVTTKPDELANYVANMDSNKLKLIISTYHSLPVVSKAQKEHNLAKIDLVICDEAHRTANFWAINNKVKVFALIHDNDQVDCQYRLYMTATPKQFKSKRQNGQKETQIQGTDDDQHYKNFGPIFYRMSFGQAIEKNLLSDYLVVMMTIPYEDVLHILNDPQFSLDTVLNSNMLCRLQGVVRSINKYSYHPNEFEDDPGPMSSLLMFSNRTKASSDHCEALEVISKLNCNQTMSIKNLEVKGIYSQYDTASSRSRKLRWLSEADQKFCKECQSKKDCQIKCQATCRILANVRCLSEGIDVANLDAIAFIEPRHSKIDIVQAVGRVMRRAKNKKYGYVILPIVYDSKTLKTKSEIIEKAGYQDVVTVVNTLRSHDNRLNYINHIRKKFLVVDGSMRTRQDQENIPSSDEEQLSLINFTDLQDHIYSFILSSVGDRPYWSRWAKKVRNIMIAIQKRIEYLIIEDDEAARCFAGYLKTLQGHIDLSIDNVKALDMLSQHMATKPIFESLFADSVSKQQNPISLGMEKTIELLNARGLKAELEPLNKDFDKIKDQVLNLPPIDREFVAHDLYDSFLQEVDPKGSSAKGIVYTPKEVIDFMNNSTNDLLQKYFQGTSLADENVHIIDPFAGTGRFLTRLIDSKELMPFDKLKHKYENNEFHVNEIVLLIYYIAAINIETIYHQRLKEQQGDDFSYQQLKTIVLTDTFKVNYVKRGVIEQEELIPPYEVPIPFTENIKRLHFQERSDIQVIISNPPYGGKLKEKNLCDRIDDTYGRFSEQGKQGLKSQHVGAIRWASDRLLSSHSGGG